MTKQEYLSLLEQPDTIQQRNTFQLKTILKTYAYFQSARALYLKGLKTQNSFKYNNELKTTAAHTTNRSVLFNFITSESFTNKASSNNSPNNIDVIQPTIIKSSEIEFEKAKKELQVEQPLSFTKQDNYSFSEWLKLSSFKPIVRETTPVKDPKKTEQDDIINKFIASNPKIPPIKKTAPTSSKPIKKSTEPELMTETLAKVYLAQKKYDNAIKAYEILSLKYPEKSGFFADQIKRIRTLQNIK